MQRICIVLLISLLTACTETQGDIQRWQGRDVTTLVAYWGQPAQLITLPTHEAYYIYFQTEARFLPMNNPPVAVSVSNGRPVIVPLQPATAATSPPIIQCTLWFTINAHNKIIKANAEGYHCATNSHSIIDRLE